MKRNKIAFKIILAFILLLLFNHISFFYIMRSLKLEQAIKDNEFYKSISNFAFKELIEKRFNPYSLDEVRNNSHFKTMLSGISRSYNLDAVVTDENDNIYLVPSNSKSKDVYSGLIRESEEDEVDIRKPFPIKIPFVTKQNENGYIYLFHEYDTSSTDTLFNILLSVLFITTLILLFFLSRIFTEPLKKFNSAIRSISNGDFSSRIELKRKDEFGQLADTFNSMAAKIEEVITEQKDTSANISHELRSPLTRINVALQILKDSKDNEELYDVYFKTIEREISGMDDLIDGILKYYRMDKFSSQSLEKIDLIKMLNNEIKKQLSSFENLNINVILNLGIESFNVNILPSIRSVFENIISNASKYTKHGGNFSVITTHEKEELMISFENDINPGSKFDIEKITEPFYRGNNSSQIKGNGMGLAIAKKICSQNRCCLETTVINSKFRILLKLSVS